jgi:hypothetical protein
MFYERSRVRAVPLPMAPDSCVGGATQECACLAGVRQRFLHFGAICDEQAGEFRRVQRAFVLHGPLRVPHGWDDTVKCSFDELAGSAVELVIAIFQAV